MGALSVERLVQELAGAHGQLQDEDAVDARQFLFERGKVGLGGDQAAIDKVQIRQGGLQAGQFLLEPLPLRLDVDGGLRPAGMLGAEIDLGDTHLRQSRGGDGRIRGHEAFAGRHDAHRCRSGRHAFQKSPSRNAIAHGMVLGQKGISRKESVWDETADTVFPQLDRNGRPHE